jgi:hypothetical protein
VTGPRTEDEWRWAEALALEKLHGSDAPRWIAERIGTLALAGDESGVERLQEIAQRLDQMLTGRGSGHA